MKGTPGGDDARASCGDNGDWKGDSEVTTKGARTGRSSCPRRTRDTAAIKGFRGRQGDRSGRDEVGSRATNGATAASTGSDLGVPRVMMLLATLMAFGAFCATAGYSLLATREAALGDQRRDPRAMAKGGRGNAGGISRVDDVRAVGSGRGDGASVGPVAASEATQRRESHRIGHRLANERVISGTTAPRDMQLKRLSPPRIRLGRWRRFARK